MHRNLKAAQLSLASGFFLLAALIVLLGLSHGYGGAATSSDSLSYLNVAKSIAAGLGVVAPDYQLAHANFSPITLWPPLYPALLSKLCLDAPCTAVGVRELTVYLNLLLELLVALVFLVLANRLLSKWLALISTAGLLLLPALQITYMFVWSETIFIPLILLAFYGLDQYFSRTPTAQPNSRGAWPMLVLAIIMVALASYTRYVGLAFAIALLLCLLVFGAGAFVGRLKTVIGSGLLYSVLISPLLLRNFTVSGHLSGGERGAPPFRLWDDCITLVRLLERELFAAQWILFAVWLAAVLLLFWLRHSRVGADASGPAEAMDRVLPMALLWSASYLVFLLISRSVQHVDLDTRMLAVILPFLLLALIAFTRYLAGHLPLEVAAVPLLVVVLASALSGYSCHQSLLNNLREEHSPGYVHHMQYFSITEPRFAVFGELAQRAVPSDDALLLTDIPRPQILSYFFTGRVVKMIPRLGEAVDFERMNPFLVAGTQAIIYSPEVQTEFLTHFGENRSAELIWVVHPGGRYLLARIP